MPPTRSRPARAASKAAKPYASISSREPSEGGSEVSEEKPDLDLDFDELDDEDVKPNLDLDEKPKRKTTKGKGKGKTKAAASTATAATGAKWSGDEDWALFQAIFPRAAKIDWNAVSAGVGRDAKVSIVLSAGLLL